MTKKKLALKITCAVLAILLIAILLLVLNGFVGNPISSAIAKNNIEKYVKQNYDRNEFEIGKVSYNFKFGEYCSFVQSKKSKDTGFQVTYRNGEIQDNYESNVTNRYMTWSRLSDEMTKQVKEVMKKEYSYKTEYAFTDCGKSADYMSQLTLDMELDIHKPPIPITLTISAITSNPSSKEVEKAMVEAYQIMKQNNIPIAYYSVSLRKPEMTDEDFKHTDDWCMYEILASEVAKMVG